MKENENSISELMLVHHGLLEVLFKSLKDNIALEPKADYLNQLIDEFQWEMEKHFFVEEKVIFSFCTATDPQSCKMIIELLHEHKRMRELLADLLDRKIQNRALTSFENLLIQHRKTEDEHLYPRLDEELNQAAKDLIFSRINELPQAKNLLK